MIGLVAGVVLAAGTAANVPPEPSPVTGMSEGDGPWVTFSRNEVSCQPAGLTGARRQELSTLRIDPSEESLIFHGVPWRVPAGHFALHPETVLSDVIAYGAPSIEIVAVECGGGERALLHLQCAQSCLSMRFVFSLSSGQERRSFGTNRVTYVFPSREAAEAMLAVARERARERGQPSETTR